jgi:putative hydrolase of the HAD superfamily
MQKHMSNLTHILFDFFGTLVAYSPSRVDQGYDQSYQLLAAQGAPIAYADFLTRWDEMFDQFERQSEASLVEFSMTDLCAAFLSAILAAPPSPELIAQFRDIYLEEWSRGIRRIPGVQEMTAELAGRYTLVLLSNTHHAELVHRQLAQAGLAPYFQRVVTSDAYGWRKPARAIFEYALNAAQGRKETALFVGDSYTADYIGAQAAGLRCLLIDPANQYPIPHAHRLSTILALPSALERPL